MILNRWHLLALAVAVGMLNMAIAFLRGQAPDVSILLNSAAVAAPLGALVVIFDKWAWRLPVLYPWFVTTPFIGGTWAATTQTTQGGEDTQNVLDDVEGTVTFKQTYFTLAFDVDWEDGAKTKSLMKSSVFSHPDGYCAFAAHWEFTASPPTRHIKTRMGAFFFTAKERTPGELKLFYCTTDGQSGIASLRRKRSN